MPISPEAGWRDRTADALFAAGAAIFVAAAIVFLAVPNRTGAAADVAAFAATWAVLVAMPVLLVAQLAFFRYRGTRLLRRLGLGLLSVWVAIVIYLATVTFS